MPLLVQVFVRHGDDQKASWAHDPDPSHQGRLRTVQVFQAMAGVHEVELVVRDARHELGVAVLDIPSPHRSHAGENPGVLAERIRPPTDVDALAYEIASMKQPVIKPPFGGLALLPHSDHSLLFISPRWRHSP